MRFLNNFYVYCFILFFSSQTLLAQNIPFKYSVVVPGVSSQARQIGDVDGDGRGDIVVVEGEFQPEILAWFAYPDWIRYDMNNTALAGLDYVADCKLGDVDGDGDLDLIFPDSQNAGDKGKRVYWFENPRPKGNPKTDTWKKHTIKDLGNVTILKEIAIGDMDGDGKMDVVVRAEAGGYIFFQNNPDSWSTIEINFRPHEGLEIGDLDRDGDVDIVLNGTWWENPGNPRTGAWKEHTFDPKWYNQNTKSWMDNNSQVRLGDLDGDGCVDIVISSSEKSGYPVSWYQAPQDPKTGLWKEHVIGQLDYCHGLQLGDIDNDGDIDIMGSEMLKGADPDKIVVFVNQGNPRDPVARMNKKIHFKEQVISTIGSYWAVLGDVGGDGDLDIVSSRSFDKAPIEMWENLTSDLALSLDKWTHILVDSTRTRYDGKTKGGGGWFGLAMGDLTSTGYSDIVSGKWLYRNPGDDMTGRWTRTTLNDSMDAILIVNVDNDERGDFIAVKCNKQYWFEAKDAWCSSFDVVEIGNLPVCNHGTGSQGYNLAQIIPGGKPEILLTGETGEGIYYMEIPENPHKGHWPWTTIMESGSNGEWISSADIDGDGLLDICGAFMIGDQGIGIAWWKNPGDRSGNWKRYHIGNTQFWADKIIGADINGDGRIDLVVTEERYPGLEPDASLYWFEAPANPASPNWKRHTLVTQYSMNNLDVADLDRDGDLDIITCEHKGPKEQLQIWENNGKGQFRKHLIDEGKESHLGAILHDLDGDGDLDIVSIAWEDFKFLHVWRNDAITR